jgi:2-hydroxychromene-2-carboxylate isomerase
LRARARLYFSFRSPFSWLTVVRLRRALPEAHDVLEFIPYWDPDPATEAALVARNATFHYVQMSKAKHLYILQDTKRLASELGVPMKWPVDVDPWWEVPHLAWLVADAHGRSRQFYDEVVAARWERGENVCDPETVRRLGERAGLDGDLLAQAADDPAVRQRGVDCLASAYDDEVFGVPYFRLGWRRYWGYDRVDTFLEALDTARPELGRNRASADGSSEEIPRELQAAVGCYDTDTAGGCG